MKNLRCLGILVILLLSGCFAVLSVDPVSAIADTHTWDGGGANALASTKENWVGDAAAPEALDSAVFDAGALPCTWDLSIALDSLTITAGYSGIITQGASFSVTSYSQAGGTFTPVDIYTLTDSGDFTHIGGTLTSTVLKLTMTGANKAITLSMGTSFYFKQLLVSGTCSFTHDTFISGVMTLQIDPGGVLTLATYLIWVSYWGTYTNSGTIAGPAPLKIVFNADVTWSQPGTITSPVSIYLHNGAVASKTLTLGAPLSCGFLQVYSEHAANLGIVSTSTFAVSTTTLTLGTRGKVIQGTGTITCTNYTQSGLLSEFVQGGNVSIGSGGFYITDGIFTGNSAYWLTDAGDFRHTGGTLTSTVLDLEMTGANKVISLVMASSMYFARLTISGSCSIIHAGGFITGVANLTINPGVVLTLTNFITYVSYWGSYVNQGTIAGPSELWVQIIASYTWSPGTITSPVKISLNAGSTQNATLTLGTPLTCGDLLVKSEHVSYLCIFANSIYAVSTTTLTLGDRGEISQGTGTITCTNYIQSGLLSEFVQGGNVSIGSGGFYITDGIFTGNSAYWLTDAGDFIHTGGILTSTVLQLKMTGANKEIHLAMVSSFYFRVLTVTGTCTLNHTEWPFTSAMGLSIETGGILTLETHLNFITYWGNYLNNGTIAGTARLNIVYDANASWIPGTITCPIYVEAHVGTPTYAILSIFLTVNSFTINVTSAATTITFVVSNLKEWGLYNIYVDGTRMEQSRADSFGQLTFTYAGPWSEHTFEFERYNAWGPLYDMGPWMLTIGIIFGCAGIVIVAIGSRIRRG